MRIRKTLMAASVAALMLGTAMSAQACFTVIVGTILGAGCDTQKRRND